MIRAVIFDIGNVLMTWDFPATLHTLLGDGETVRRVERAIWGTGYWRELDRGGDPGELFPKILAAEPDYAREIQYTLNHIADGMGPKDYAISWLCALKERGYRVLYLSNYSEFVMEADSSVLNFLPLMEGGIFSCYERLIKPDPAIYRLLLERYGLEPGECVFLDDTEENVRAAQALGMLGIHFLNYEQGSAALERLLAPNIQSGLSI